MQRILFLTPQLPYPPHSGGTFKSWKLVEYLSKRYRLTIGTLLKGHDSKNLNEFTNRIKLEKLYTQEINIPRTIQSLISSYICHLPLIIYRTYSERFRRSIYGAIHSADIVFLDHCLMSCYIPNDYVGRVILHEHNAEFILWQRAGRFQKNIFKKLLIYREAERIKRYEKEICMRSNVILAAPNDIASLRSIEIPGEKFYETLHLGDENLLEQPNLEFFETTKSLLFVGTLTWESNIDCLLWFIENVWNTLKKMNPDLVFTIVGKDPDKRLQKTIQGRNGLTLAGFVDNLEDCYRHARVFVAPLRFGSGIKVKIINAMYRGLPISTTPIGTEGLIVHDMLHMAIADNSQKMINDIHILLNDKNKWELLRDQSRKLALQAYQWDAVLKNVERAIDQCLM